LQARGAAECSRYYAAVCEAAEVEVVTPRGNYFSFSTYERSRGRRHHPWNSPLTMDSAKLAPALGGGKRHHPKPLEVTPQIGLELGQLALEAGFPAGIVTCCPEAAPRWGVRWCRTPASTW